MRLGYYYKQGKKYNYPTCCVTAFLLRNYLILPWARPLVEMTGRIWFIQHKKDPLVKCPYHSLKSILQGKAKFRWEKVCTDACCECHG